MIDDGDIAEGSRDFVHACCERAGVQQYAEWEDTELERSAVEGKPEVGSVSLPYLDLKIQYQPLKIAGIWFRASF